MERTLRDDMKINSGTVEISLSTTLVAIREKRKQLGRRYIAQQRTTCVSILDNTTLADEWRTVLYGKTYQNVDHRNGAKDRTDQTRHTSMIAY